ncbi:Toxin-antitoxin system, toxin component, RelE family [Fusobacterium sp. oral taxon C10]
MMSYKFISTIKFKEDLSKLDGSVVKTILKYIKKLELSDNPKAYGKELSGNMAGLYRFRINNYRIITKFENGKFTIEGLATGHRRNIYNVYSKRLIK